MQVSAKKEVELWVTKDSQGSKKAVIKVEPLGPKKSTGSSIVSVFLKSELQESPIKKNKQQLIIPP